MRAMSLTAREIEEVVQELQPLVGGFVQKLHVPSSRTVTLELRRPGTSYLLLICAEPGRTRIHLAEERAPAQGSPPPLQSVLRSELIGLALEALEAMPGERVVRLRFRGKERVRTLIGELLGRHGNLFLLDEEGRILAAAGPVLSPTARPEGAERRDNRPGQLWTPPPPRQPSEAERRQRFDATGEPMGLSRAVAAAYSVRERQETIAQRRQQLRAAVKTKRDRLARTVEKVQGDLKRMEKADEHLRRGELLKSNLHKLKKGMSEARLTDWTEEGPVEVVVPLDPARTPLENLERAFHQYKRLSAGQTRALERLLELEEARAKLDEELARIDAMTDEELLARPAASIPTKRKGQGPRLPYREFLSASGQRIRVGKNARDNDALTLRHSRGNDLWLHVRGVPGSHVVVPLGREERVHDETLRDAALLAAHFSEEKGRDRVEVAWTRVKYVRKSKGAPPGAVTYSQEKSVLVSPDPERLARLMARTDEEGA